MCIRDRTKIAPNYISNVLQEPETKEINAATKIIWLGCLPETGYVHIDNVELATLLFYDKVKTFSVKMDKAQGDWLAEILKLITPDNSETPTLKQIREMYESAGLKDFDSFWSNRQMTLLKKNGLVVL